MSIINEGSVIVYFMARRVKTQTIAGILLYKTVIQKWDNSF